MTGMWGRGTYIVLALINKLLPESRVQEAGSGSAENTASVCSHEKDRDGLGL